MGDAPSVELFVEDVAHERFLSALIRRIGGEEGVLPTLSIRTARGGHGQVFAELKLVQQIRKQAEAPDILVVGIDANCLGWKSARNSILGSIQEGWARHTVIACPDPHIERWFLADPRALAELGARATLPRRKCERDLYKSLLIDALTRAGHPVMLGGAEFAEDLVAGMDLFAAAKSEPSLKAFVQGIRAALKTYER